MVTGRPPIWLFTLLSALLGIGEAFFTPALTALTADIVPREHLSDANATVMQQRVAADALARTTAFSLTGTLALGSAAFTVIGPVAAVTGPDRLLGFAAAWGFLSSTAVIALPVIRSIT